MKISVVIPIFNEEGNIEEMYRRTSLAIQTISNEYEIIFVNDFSKDNSLPLIKKITLEDKHVQYISFSRNFGHQVAVCAGLDYAKGKAIVVIDGDLQDPPELIPQMYEKYKGGYKVVYAKRSARKGVSIFKNAAYKLFYRILNKLTTIKIPLDTGDFRLIDRVIIEHLKNMPERNKFIRGQIAWIGYKQTCVEYVRDPRLNGKTGYSFSKLMKLALDGITGFSDKPLKIASNMGLIVSLISFVFIVYALISYFVFKTPLHGWTSLMIGISFIGGVQLITLGIIGEYISRINNDVRKRPLYIIEESNTSTQTITK
ncbi:MAG: putative glycosyltransferase [Candidatus Ordinivivax streblomastigis]|uniref:Putative glycosyltransferase n=1 Tax=Candidatus Ordinivivax streblomastigis TaxID=2540710 RepID=A0A5M8P3B1_9BACT|nr:MAG: putative glycosyltransferase [Candidatus Ordinivivax streblomastigis]